MKAIRRFFVNLPLRWIAADPAYLDYFVEHRLNPEIGLDMYFKAELSLKDHERIADRLRRNDIKCAVHLHFREMQPGSADPVILDAVRARLKEAWQISELYAPSHIIGHAGFNPLLYNGEFYAEWLHNSVDTWSRLLEYRIDEEIPFYLENTHEEDLKPIIDVLSSLTDFNAGLCFDIGHWYSFSDGCRKDDLENWLESAGKHLTHLHLHDNDGSFDQHLGLGAGTIPLERMFNWLRSNGIRCGITLEPHSEGDLLASLAYLEKNASVLEHILS